MVTITFEVPDEIAEQLARHKPQLTELLVGSFRRPMLPIEAYRHILEFIANRPTPEQLAAFEPMLQIRERLRSLLARERSGELSPFEKAELVECEWIEHIVVMLKASNLDFLSGNSGESEQ